MPATLYTPTNGGWDLFDDTPLAGGLEWGKALLYDADKTTVANADWNVLSSYGLDLGTQKEVKTIICYDNRASTTWQGPEYDSVEVYKSNDDITWTLVQTFDAPPREAGKFTLVLAAAQTARYFKVRNKDPFEWLMVTVGQVLWITELEFYSPPRAYKIEGTVELQGSPAIRLVRLHVRSTGAVVHQTNSNPNGTYELDAPDDTTELYVIAFDDLAGEQYNALIYDRVKGVLQP